MPMRTLKFVVMIVVAVLATGCATRSATVVSAPAKPLAIEEEVEQVRTRESIIRLRAEEIRLKKRIEEAQKELRKVETPEERQARKELEREERGAAKLAKASAEILQWANITGCESGTVAVNPSAVRPGWLDRQNVMVSVRIINTTPLTYNIETPLRGIGLAVRGLCPGGSVTLAFARDMLTDSQRVDIALIAISEPSAGQGVVTEERRLTLNASNVNNNRVRSEIWRLTRRR